MGKVSEGSKAARFGFIAEHGAAFGIRYLCDRLGVSPAGFYKWQSRDEAGRTLENRRLAKRIQKLFAEHDGNYGSPRIHVALRKAGEIVKGGVFNNEQIKAHGNGQVRFLYKSHQTQRYEWLRLPTAEFVRRVAELCCRRANAVFAIQACTVRGAGRR